MEPGTEGNSVISLQQCNLLAGIISYWASGLALTVLFTNGNPRLHFWQITHSNEEIGGDDWFTLVTD